MKLTKKQLENEVKKYIKLAGLSIQDACQKVSNNHRLEYLFELYEIQQKMLRKPLL